MDRLESLIKVVLIDIDNTLLSFTGYVKEAMREGFSFFGLNPYTEDMFPAFEKINNSLWGQLEQFEEYFRERLFYSAVPEDGAVDLLKYLSSKYTLCAASNGPYDQQMNRLRVGEMANYFDHCFISSQIGAQKPGRQFFDRCFSILRESGFPKLAPEEVIIIGDSISSDISGGCDYGMHTCLYQKNGNSERSDHGAEHVVGSLSEIKRIL